MNIDINKLLAMNFDTIHNAEIIKHTMEVDTSNPNELALYTSSVALLNEMERFNKLLGDFHNESDSDG